MRGGRQPGALGALLVVVVGVAIVAIAQFTLDSLSLSSPSWHLIQHGIIAVGGVVVGVGATRLYQMGQPQAGRYPSAMAASLVLVVGAGLVTFGQFYVDSLPDLTQAVHWLAHGLVFAGGVLIGEAAYSFYLREQARSLLD